MRPRRNPGDRGRLGAELRSGELRGLTWADVDWDARTITVRRSMQRIDGRFVALEPKTAGSRRTVALPDVAMVALSDLRQRQASSSVIAAYAFANERGEPLHGTTVWRALQGALVAAGLPPMPFHALRHTTASLLLSQGLHPRVVADQLGHSRVGLTLDTYSHVIPALRRDAADEMERMLTS